MEAQDGRECREKMSRRPATFTKADLARALTVAREHGMTVEVAPDGTLRIVPEPSPTVRVDSGKVWVT
jgi:hypothetical protein